MSDPIIGVDLSHYQGSITWPTLVAAGIKFAFIKASQGLETDPAFLIHQHYLLANSTLIPYSFYHFYDTRLGALQQANYFCNLVETLGPNTLPPVLDFEEDLNNGEIPLSQRATDLSLFLSTVKAKLKKTPIIYTNTAFFESYLGIVSSGFGAYPLWISEYPFSHQVSVNDPVPDTKYMRLPTGFPTYTFWQFSENCLIPGANDVDGVFDLNVFNGSSDDLKALCA
jgi:GH25 family lysozyme M1 (1,4-beta-N-acetylmuramidase)